MIQGPELTSYFRLVALYDKENVIPFLEQKKYNILEIQKICKETGNQRGDGYLMFKQGKSEEGLQVYKSLIREIIKQKFSQEEIEKIIRDVMGFNLYQINVELILFLSTLSVKQKDELKKRYLIQKTFSIWKSFDYLIFFELLQNEGYLDKFMQNPYLIKIFVNKLNRDFYLKDIRMKFVYKQFHNTMNLYLDKELKGKLLKIKACYNLKRDGEPIYHLFLEQKRTFNKQSTIKECPICNAKKQNQNSQQNFQLSQNISKEAQKLFLFSPNSADPQERKINKKLSKLYNYTFPYQQIISGEMNISQNKISQEEKNQ